MTATGSGRRALRLRTVLGLARAEASLRVRSPLVLAGLLVGGGVVWLFIRSTEPLWWRADWEIGGGQLVLGMAVLAAAQLAAGRPRRDAMAALYASFPATAGTRTVAHLASLAGAAPASLRRQLPSLEAPVNGVLARLPAQPGRPAQPSVPLPPSLGPGPRPQPGMQNPVCTT